MTNSNFLKKYIYLQHGKAFDKIIDINFSLITYLEKDNSGFFNFALVTRIISDSEIKEIEETLKSLNRDSTIYFENNKELKSLTLLLKNQGYKKEYEDSWMFWEGREISNDFSQVKKVKNKEDLRIFLETFDSCYQKDDPQNPYGEVKDYLSSVEKSWHEFNKNNELEYFVIYKNRKPVAVASLTNYEGIGYISNVGSLLEVRGEGFGKIATLYCIKKSIENKNTEHCLATEEDSYPNSFYKRIGFKTRFTAEAYKKILK